MARPSALAEALRFFSIDRLSSLSPAIAAIAAIAIILATLPAAWAQTGLPVPRFVSLRSNEVNLRTGPGLNYPVEWVYVRRDMPVEIIAEFDTWRKIRDWQGTEGWVHQSLLAGDRTAIVRGTVRQAYGEPRADAGTVVRMEPGVIVRLLECRPDWCRIAVKDFEGWLRRDAFWGAYPGETFE